MYVVPGTIAAGCLVMLMRFEHRMASVEMDVKAAKQKLNAETDTLTKGLAAIHERVQMVDPPLARTASIVSGANATTRSKVLKMHRLGGSPEQIATVLHLPKGEVTLLLKVHQIVMQAIEQPRAGLEMASAEEKA
jgi:hypothetical protein